jgi:pimeloyl-ACP methyl ester carboxylesterase
MDGLAVRPALAEVKRPTLIVWGTGDMFFPKWAQRLAGLIPGTTTVLLQARWESHDS